MMNPASKLQPHHIFRGPYVLMSMAACLIFVMDLMGGGGVPYIGVVLLSLRHRNPQLPL